MNPLGPDWESESLPFILPPSAHGVQDSQEWPELAPNTLLSGPGPGWRAVPRPRRKQTPSPGPRICHVAGGCADLPRAKCPVPPQETQVLYVSGSGSLVLEVCQVA